MRLDVHAVMLELDILATVQVSFSTPVCTTNMLHASTSAMRLQLCHSMKDSVHSQQQSSSLFLHVHSCR